MNVEFTDVELCSLLWQMKGYSAKETARQMVVPVRLVTDALQSARQKMIKVYAQRGRFVFPGETRKAV